MATAHPSRGRIRGPGAATLAGTAFELTLGSVALTLAGVAGLAFVHRPLPNRLDVWGYQALPANFSSRWAHDFVALGSLTALITGVIAVLAIGLLRDWVRAVAC